MSDEPILELPMTPLPMGVMVEIPIEDIYVNPKANRRKEIDPNTLTSLIRSIKQTGLQEPVLVTKSDPRDATDKPYALVAGFRRIKSCSLAELSSILAIIRDIPYEERVFINLIENLERQDLSQAEEADGVLHLQKIGYSVQQIAQKLNRSLGWVADRIRLNALPEEVRNLAYSQVIPAATISKIAALPEEEQRAATQNIRTELEKRAETEAKPIKIVVPDQVAVKQKLAGTTKRPRSIKEIKAFRDWWYHQSLPAGIQTVILAWILGDVDDQMVLDTIESAGLTAECEYYERPKALLPEDMHASED